MRANEIITEGRDAPLYHNLDSQKALSVFSNDSMPALWEHDFPGMGRVKGNSFTRNKYYRDGYPVQIRFDQAKLEQTHKMIPVNSELIHRMNMANHSRREYGGDPPLTVHDLDVRDRHKRLQDLMSEEFVVGDINNLHRYITKIILHKAIELDGMHFIKEYAKKYKIPLLMSESTKKIMDRDIRNLNRLMRQQGQTRHDIPPVPHPVAARQAYFDRYHGNKPKPLPTNLRAPAAPASPSALNKDSTANQKSVYRVSLGNWGGATEVDIEASSPDEARMAAAKQGGYKNITSPDQINWWPVRQLRP